MREKDVAWTASLKESVIDDLRWFEQRRETRGSRRGVYCAP